MKATIVADLTGPNAIPDKQFDCIICTHVLHVIRDPGKFVAELYRILKPGGVLLAAVPQISMCDPSWGEMWRFTGAGLGRVLSESFEDGNVTIRMYGNSLTAAGEIRGLTRDDFKQEELNFHDARFAVEVCGRAVKKTGRCSQEEAWQ